MMFFILLFSKNKRYKVLGFIVAVTFYTFSLVAVGYGEKWGEIGPIGPDWESDQGYTEPHERLEVKPWGITLRYVRSSPFGIDVTIYNGGRPNKITDVWGIEAIYKEITTGENYILSFLTNIPFPEIKKLSEPKGESIHVELDYNFIASLYRATGLYELAKRYESLSNEELKMREKIESMTAALKDNKDDIVRWNAAEALGKTGDARAIEPLIAALKDDKDHYVREKAAEALGKITGQNFRDNQEKWQKWWKENKAKYLK